MSTTTLQPGAGILAATGHASVAQLATFLTPGAGVLLADGLAPIVVPPLQRYASRDLDDLARFYDGRLLEDPAVTTKLSDLFWGTVQVSDVKLRLRNEDDGLSGLYAGDPRGTPVTLRRYDRISGITSIVYRGQVVAAARDVGVVELNLSNLDPAIFETTLPRGVVDTTLCPLAIDVGKPLTVVLGTVPKVPLLYIREDLLGNSYDYFVARGAVTVTAAYRNGQNKTFYPIQGSEYTLSTTLYPGWTVLRFPVQQVDFNNQRHQLWADVTGLQPERNFARAVRSVLSDPVWGLGLAVDTGSFASAEAALDSVGGLYCDGALTTPTQAQVILRELLLVRGMRLGLNLAGEWTCAVDMPRGLGALALGDGLGDGPRNVLRAGPRAWPAAADSIRTTTVHYRLDVDGQTFLFTQPRVRAKGGKLQEFLFTFIRDHGTADRVSDFIFKRLIAGEETVSVDLEVAALAEGDLVTLSLAFLGYDGDLLEVQQVDLTQAKTTAILRGYDAAAYLYTPGTLPSDDALGLGTDFSRTAPSPVTNLANAGWTIGIGADGTTSATVTLRFDTPTSNYAQAIARFRVNGTTDWSAGTVVTAAGVGVTVLVPGLIPAQHYDFTVQVMNAYALLSAGDPILSNQAAPNDTVAPATPAPPTIASQHLSVVSFAWTAVADLDILNYEWDVRTAAAGGGSLVDSGSTPGPGPALTRDFAALPWDTDRYFRVRARDRSGNLSAYSTAVTFQIHQVATSDVALLAIVTGLINDLAVLTGKINANAVTNLAATRINAPTNTSSPTYADISGLSVTLTTTGAPVLVTVMLDSLLVSNNDAGTQQCGFACILFRDGGAVSDAFSGTFSLPVGGAYALPLTFTFLDAGAAAGAHTYTVQWAEVCAGTAATLTNVLRAIEVMEVKR